MSDVSVSRRDFIRSTAPRAAEGAAASLATAAAATRAAGAHQRLRISSIGPGRLGIAARVKSPVKLRARGANIDLVSVNDVYSVHCDWLCS